MRYSYQFILGYLGNSFHAIYHHSRIQTELRFEMSLVLVAERRRCGKHALDLEDFFHCFVNFEAMPHFKWVWKCNLTSAWNEGNQNHRGQQEWWWQIYSRSLYVISKVLCSHLLWLFSYLRLILVRKIKRSKILWLNF